MASGINLSLVVNSRDAIRSFERTGESIEDVADVLEDVASESRRTGRALEGDSKDAGRVVDKEAADMEKSFKEAFRTAKKESKDAGRDIERNTKTGMDGAVDTVGEFRDEATSNFSEVASSFTGDMDSAIDLVQGTLGGLAGSIPGVGLALGTLGAVAGTVYAQWSENTEKTKQAVSDMVDDMIESGNRYVSQELINQSMLDIVRGSEDALYSMQDVARYAESTGLPENSILRALAGDANAINELMPIVQQNLEDVGGKIAEAKNQSDGYANTTALNENYNAWNNIAIAIGGVSDRQDEARRQVEQYDLAVRQSEAVANIDKNKAAWDRARASVAETDAAVRNIPENPKITPTFDSGVFESQFLAFARQPRTVPVNVEFRTRYGRGIE